MPTPKISHAQRADDLEQQTVRFVVGVDLGTTNSALSYIDLTKIDDAINSQGTLVETFLIPQGVAPNVVEERPTLPSFFIRSHDAPALPGEPTGAQRRDYSTKRRGANAVNDGKFAAVGIFARDYGPNHPESFVYSAKSWLCHSGIDRNAKILPIAIERDDEPDLKARAPKWSPVEISSYYLAHLRNAWNVKFPDAPLEEQDIVITIPASFDETARELTIEAAKLAGLPRVLLVEEPQAAFYSWLQKREGNWTEYVAPGDKILVCDVGGGTTDFALIYALERELERNDLNANAGKSVKFYRVAVGEHLLLGGDNLDLALFHYLEQKALGARNAPLSRRERALLLKESREIKEAFLSDERTDDVRRITLTGGGSKLVGGSVTIEARREDVERILVDGFFPTVPLESAPDRRRAGLRELALPYAQDPAITKHLAYFLTRNRESGKDLARAGALDGVRRAFQSARPDAVLFNGGAFESPKLRERIVDSIAEWFQAEEPGWRPKVLANEALDLAVARGAAYYGLVLRGRGSRIGASLARSYYVQVGFESTDGKNGAARPLGACLLAAQAEPGDASTLPQIFELEVDRPVAFPIFVSSVRMTDEPGDLVVLDPTETRELPPIRTALRSRSAAKKTTGRIRARIVARPTEIGTIELFLQEVLDDAVAPGARASRWALKFDARGATQTDWTPGDASGELAGVEDESVVERGVRIVESTFGADAELAELSAKDGEERTRIKPRDFMRATWQALGVDSKNDAPITTLRRLGERALELDAEPRKSAPLEARWLNWLGFSFRPGFGSSADDWRVEQTWKKVYGRLAHGIPECRAQYWILWRRIASGLTSGRQQTLAEPLLANVRNLRRQLTEGRGKGADLDLSSQEGAEIWRLLGALELLTCEQKEELGDSILDVFFKRKMSPVRDALVWSLGRLGARRLFHAPLDRTVPARVSERWANLFLDRASNFPDLKRDANLFLALAQLVRSAEDGAFDVDGATRDRIEAYLDKHGATETTLAALDRRGRLLDDATSQIFGESLPLGLNWSE